MLKELGQGLGVTLAVLAWGFAMLVAAGGDFGALWEMRSVPNSAQVEDNAEGAGCRLVTT